MASFTQAELPLQVTTSLGPDVLLPAGLAGNEGISELFTFQLDLLAENVRDIAFEKLLGQPVTVRIINLDGKPVFYNGVCKRVSQGESDETFTRYFIEFVPAAWLLSRRVQSRIFQHLSVVDILKSVLGSLDVDFQLRSTYPKRVFCVQYQESDFHFVSRLMEEEGIFYFFKHADGKHTMVIGDSPQVHPSIEPGSVIFQRILPGKTADEDRIHEWLKGQEIRSGKYTVWDHSFELPHKHLEAERLIGESVAAGGVTHSLKAGPNDALEIFEHPGGYAQWFDGVAKDGSDNPAELQKIFDENRRLLGIRMQQEAVAAVTVTGKSSCRTLRAGHKFNLAKHGNGDGAYVLTRVTVKATITSDYLTGGEVEFKYDNTFACLPGAQPFRPPRNTPRPYVRGTQTAVVVGPSGEEVHTDKYGRVKIQFHWDREGMFNADSSGWVRVSTAWGGKQWGAVHVPRIGQEVVVDFLEGNPDRPIIVGSVFNAEMMPPYKLPESRTQSGMRSRSTPNGDIPHFNELRFEDKKDSEYVYFHAEKDFNRVVENNDSLLVGGNRAVVIAKGDEVIRIRQGKGETEAMQSIELKVGKNSIKVDATGITLKGLLIKIEGEVQTVLAGTTTMLRGVGLLKLEGPIVMTGPAPITPATAELGLDEEEQLVGAGAGRGATGGGGAGAGASGAGAAGAGAGSGASGAGAGGAAPPAAAPAAPGAPLPGAGTPIASGGSAAAAPGAASAAAGAGTTSSGAVGAASPAAGSGASAGAAGTGGTPVAKPGSGATPPILGGTGAGSADGSPGAAGLPQDLSGLPRLSTLALSDILEKSGISGISAQALNGELRKASSAGLSGQALGDQLRQAGAKGVTNDSLGELLRRVQGGG